MSPRDQLNLGEVQVATMVWEGKTNPEIVAVIGSTEPVVKNLLRGIFDKLGFGAGWSWRSIWLDMVGRGGQPSSPRA